MSEEIHIIEEEPIKIRGPNVIIGLPDVGLVGLIATINVLLASTYCLPPLPLLTISPNRIFGAKG